MNQYDKERQERIGETLITVKLFSLLFFMIAIFVETPKHTFGNYSFFNLKFSNLEAKTLLGNVMIIFLLVFSLIFVSYYNNRINKFKSENKKQKIYDIFEILAFLLLDTLLIFFSGANESPYKIISFLL